MQPTPKPAPGPGLSEWARLAERIRRDSSEACQEFRIRYQRGVQVLFRRQLGPVGLTQLVEETLNGALREIRSGAIGGPADLTHFLRNVLERESMVRELGTNSSLVALAGATEHTRLRRDSLVIHEALSTFSGIEQEALRAYYEGELSLEDAAQRIPGGLAAFALLREQLYAAVRAGGMQQPAAAVDTSDKHAADGLPQRALAATNSANGVFT